jgi:hypothetical protein
MMKISLVIMSVIVLAGCQSDGPPADAEPSGETTAVEKPEKKRKINIISAEEAARNYVFNENHLVGSWLCEWIDDPKGVGSEYVYRFYADGRFQSFYPGKETNEGIWHVTYDDEGPWLWFETKVSVDHKMDTRSKGLIRVNSKGDFEIHAFFRDGNMIANNKLQYTTYVPGTVPEVENYSE